MNTKEKREQLVAEYNRNNQTIQQLQARQHQIVGQLNLLEEIEREPKELKEEKKTKK